MREALPPLAADRRRALAWMTGAASLALGPGVSQGSESESPSASPLPALGLTASDGQPVLAERGSPWRLTFVDFWASWCAPCRLAFPWLNEMHERFGGQGLRIVGVCLDRRQEDALRFLERWPARFPIAMDPAAGSARQWAVKVMPSSFALDPQRRLVFAHQGFRLEDRPGLERRLQAALA